MSQTDWAALISFHWKTIQSIGLENIARSMISNRNWLQGIPAHNLQVEKIYRMIHHGHVPTRTGSKVVLEHEVHTKNHAWFIAPTEIATAQLSDQRLLGGHARCFSLSFVIAFTHSWHVQLVWRTATSVCLSTVSCDNNTAFSAP